MPQHLCRGDWKHTRLFTSGYVNEDPQAFFFIHLSG